MKRILLVFILAFLLNLIWENLHSFLYANYMGGKITEFILLRASAADALIVTILVLPFVFIAALRSKSWIVIFAGVLIAIFIELYALQTGRWAYNSFMPVIPLLNTGLTPTIQLGVLAYIVIKAVEKTKSGF